MDSDDDNQDFDMWEPDPVDANPGNTAIVYTYITGCI